MEHSEFKFPTEWLNGDSDEFATVTPTKTVEKPPADHYLTHFPKHLGCESCFKAKTQKTRTGGKVKIPNFAVAKTREVWRHNHGEPFEFL